MCVVAKNFSVQLFGKTITLTLFLLEDCYICVCMGWALLAMLYVVPLMNISKATLKKSLFPVQRVAKIVASRAAAIKKIGNKVASKNNVEKKMKIKVSSQPSYTYPAATQETTLRLA